MDYSDRKCRINPNTGKAIVVGAATNIRLHKEAGTYTPDMDAHRRKTKVATVKSEKVNKKSPTRAKASEKPPVRTKTSEKSPNKANKSKSPTKASEKVEKVEKINTTKEYPLNDLRFEKPLSETTVDGILERAGAKVISSSTVDKKFITQIFVVYELPKGDKIRKLTVVDKDTKERAVSYCPNSSKANVNTFTGKIINGRPVFKEPQYGEGGYTDIYYTPIDGKKYYYKVKNGTRMNEALRLREERRQTK